MNTDVRPVFVALKAASLFVLINVFYAALEFPMDEVSLYNTFLPGRERLPFSSNNDPFVITIDDADAMLATHAISARKDETEIHVVFIGDSSVWGEGLAIHDTLTGQFNQLEYTCRGKTIRAYNLGYPHPSILKDLILIEKVRDSQPDLIVWLVTLNTVSSQRLNPFLIVNRDEAISLIEKYNIPFMPKSALMDTEATFYQKTIVGQRSYLARLIKLQALGAVWFATRTDMNIPSREPMTIPSDVKSAVDYHRLQSVSDLDQIMLLSSRSK